MNPNNPTVQLDEVCHAYRQGRVSTEVLCGVSERFGAGEFAVVLGRSGSGKTTLLNLIGGMDVPSRGEIRVMGRRISAMPETHRARLRREWIGMVFQGANLVPTLSAWENVALPLTLQGMGLRQARFNARAELAALGLEALAGRFPHELSGGEQQRVAIARAICHRPPLVLADEPTGNLDLDTALQVVSLLDHLVRAHGITLIMATHSLEVAGHADRMLCMVAGRLRDQAHA